MGGFDEDEHAVFGTNQCSGAEAEKADGVVKEYAAGLFGVEWVDEKAQVEGWEVAVGVFHRVRGGREMSGKVGDHKSCWGNSKLTDPCVVTHPTRADIEGAC